MWFIFYDNFYVFLNDIEYCIVGDVFGNDIFFCLCFVGKFVEIFIGSDFCV